MALCQNESIKVVMGEQKLTRIASKIVECIHHGLEIYPRLKSIKLVVEKVLASNLLQLDMFDSFLPPKIVVAIQELVVGVCTSLVETKHANYALHFDNNNKCKGIIFIAMARVFGVHHQNVSKAIVHRAVTCDIEVPLWTFLVKEKRNDDNPHVIKNIVVNWWTGKTRMNPNKNNVTRKRLEVGIFHEKPTHFLMET